MSRPFYSFGSFPLVVLLAALTTGCGTIYSDVYSPRRSRFVPPVERTVRTELPPETTTTTTTTTTIPADAGMLAPGAPLDAAPAAPASPDMLPDAAAGVPGLETVPGMEAAPAPAPGMDAVPAPAPGMEAAPAPEGMAPEAPGMQ